MPTDVQVHDATWVMVTMVGYFGLFFLILTLMTVWAILWQWNCILREMVLSMRADRLRR